MDDIRITSRKVVFKNDWIVVDEKSVVFPWSADVLKYYSLRLPDYVCIIGETVEGLFPLVRQYRPAVERVTWEFPSGTVEADENPESTARRELSEETGFQTPSLLSLGKYTTDVGRSENAMYGFYARDIILCENHKDELGLSTRLVTLSELNEMIEKEEFNFALHLAVWESYQRMVYRVRKYQ